MLGSGLRSRAGMGVGVSMLSGMYRPASSSREVSKLAVGDSYWILRWPPDSARVCFGCAVRGEQGAGSSRERRDQSAPYARELWRM